MASEDSASFAGVVKKEEEKDAELEQEDEILGAIEADLNAAESRVEKAMARYEIARRQVERELAKPLTEEPSEAPARKNSAEEKEPDADQAEQSAEKGITLKGSKEPKNAGALSDKEVGRERWVAKRNAESRVRAATKRARERLRRGARDKKFQGIEAVEDEQAPAEVEKAAAPVAPKKPDLGLGESAAVKEGAQGIADRLKCRTYSAENLANLVKVLTGGRENCFTFYPSDIVEELKGRGLIESDLSAQLLKVLQDSAPPPAKGAPLPPDQWLAHAQKMSAVEPLDDKPFKDSELTFLKWMDEKGLVAAEAELAAAEAQLQGLVQKVETKHPEVLSGESPELRRQASPSEPKVDEDMAERLEAQHDGDRESKGKKNTSALSEKVVSAQKWEAARGAENREREKEKIAREARRTEARDRKMDSADVGEDA